MKGVIAVVLFACGAMAAPAPQSPQPSESFGQLIGDVTGQVIDLPRRLVHQIFTPGVGAFGFMNPSNFMHGFGGGAQGQGQAPSLFNPFGMVQSGMGLANQGFQTGASELGQGFNAAQSFIPGFGGAPQNGATQGFGALQNGIGLPNQGLNSAQLGAAASQTANIAAQLGQQALAQLAQEFQQGQISFSQLQSALASAQQNGLISSRQLTQIINQLAPVANEVGPSPVASPTPALLSAPVQSP